MCNSFYRFILIMFYFTDILLIHGLKMWLYVFFCVSVILYCLFLAAFWSPAWKGPSSQAKGTKSTSFLTHKERSGLSTLGLQR